MSLNDACVFRIGRLDSNQAVEGGKYPFFTCAEQPSSIDHFAFDDSVVLVAGNNAAGNFHISRFSGKFNAYQRTYILTSKTGYDLDYIYYSLKLLLRLLKEHSQGSQTKFLTIGILKSLRLKNIPLDDQRRIASVLSTIDEKIEINNRINAELEALSKLIYDYWFVQFDFPISAEQAASMGRPDLEGKPYRSSGGPMVYNSTLKREIPEGWEAGELEDIAEITMGQSPPGESYNDTAMGDLFFQGSTDFGWRFPLPRKYTTAATRIALEGDILLSVRAPVGAMNVAPFRCAIGRGLSALRSRRGQNAFLFWIMRNLQQVFDRRNGDGTTFGSINRDDLRSLKVVLPPNGLVGKYEDLTAKNNELILVNHRQNCELTQLRDWLLPMLMNGQVTVN